MKSWACCLVAYCHLYHFAKVDIYVAVSEDLTLNNTQDY